MEFPSPISDRQWIDGTGTVWRIRRGELRWSRISGLIRDPAVQVLRFYMRDAMQVPPGEREALLATIRPYLRGSERAPDDHTDFAVAEFKSDDHRSTLIIEESC
ncbi:hypothetical protein E1263_31695 [Kribbella antibiotica]|uniref:Uncharacterized protein n=1 Tax=Kribbella antibiotica TaxID=190195 RepID=A0A4R4YWD7_9ACTN|nr:hypothetical protein [Kribbella antibiotica]TDD49768.1 hypothetical protein E1263_31695 [Kribbella antibiotica]